VFKNVAVFYLEFAHLTHTAIVAHTYNLSKPIVHTQVHLNLA